MYHLVAAKWHQVARISLLYVVLANVQPSSSVVNVDRASIHQTDKALWEQTKREAGAPVSESALNFEDSWNYWWSYTGVSGPAYWGLNLDWSICNKGTRQSPINIETSALVYDPNLTPLQVDNNLISALLINDGHSLVLNSTMHLKDASLLDNTESSNLPISIISDKASNGETVDLQARGQVAHPRAQKASDDTSIPRKPGHVDKTSGDDSLASSSDLVAPTNHSNLYMIPDAEFEEEDTNADIGSDLQANGLKMDHLSGSASSKVHFQGAGLPYSYKFEALYLRFGAHVEGSAGSEHRINSRAYPAELQLLAYNTLLYRSFSEASTRPYGLLAISVLIEVVRDVNQANNPRAVPNAALESLLSNLDSVKYRGQSTLVRNFSIVTLLPETDYFVTYRGSLTTPGCHESVQWVLLNKPLYIRQTHLDALRLMSADEQSGPHTGTFIAGNVRPLQALNGRPVRTNIKPSMESAQNQEVCQMLWARYAYKLSE